MIIVSQQIEEYISINIDTSYQNYDGAVSYSFGDIVFSSHWYYKSITDNNIGNEPLNSDTNWLLWGISNRYAQIDLRSTTTTIWDAETASNPSDNALITTFANDRFNVLALGNIVGESIKVELFNDNDQLIWESEHKIYQRPSSNNWFGFYYDRFGGDIVQSTSYFNLPATVDGWIKVTVKEYLGKSEVGFMVAGHSDYVGDSKFGVGLGLQDNSLIEVDDWGITSIKKREANQSMDIDVVFDSRNVKAIQRITKKHLGTIALFVGDDGSVSEYENLLILGYIENFTTILSNPNKTSASYSIKEVI